MKDATIKDIAEKAGVSITTVSRVINGNYPVSKDTEARVRAAMKETDFHPNAVAQSLRNNRTNLVALIIADLSNQFFMEIAKGLETKVEEMGASLMIASSGNSPEREEKIIERLIARKVDGLVIASSGKGSIPAIRKIQKSGIPLVLVDRPLDEVDVNQILWNDSSVAYKLTELLIQNGHKKIGAVNVTLTNRTGKLRYEGFLKALEDNGIPVTEKYVSDSNFGEEEAYRFVSRIMNEDDRPTALVAMNNIMAMGTLRALRDLGLSVGEDVSLVVFGNIGRSQYLPLPVTHAFQDSLSMGAIAGETLSRSISKPSACAVRTVIDCPIVEGMSIKTIK